MLLQNVVAKDYNGDGQVSQEEQRFAMQVRTVARRRNPIAAPSLTCNVPGLQLAGKRLMAENFVKRHPNRMQRFGKVHGTFATGGEEEVRFPSFYTTPSHSPLSASGDYHHPPEFLVVDGSAAKLQPERLGRQLPESSRDDELAHDRPRFAGEAEDQPRRDHQ